MSKLPVLSDSTRSARIIGHAADAKEAESVFAAYMAEREILAEGEEPARPGFFYRNPHGARFDEIDDEAIRDGYFEPLG